MSRVIRRFSRPGRQRGTLLRVEAHPDRQQGERGAAPEESIAGRLDPADGDARDVVLAVGEQDDGRPDRVGGEVLGRLLHRGDVVRVDADLLRQAGVEALAVRACDRAQAAGELGDRLRAVQEVQVGAARVVDRLRRELDDARRRVARDKVRRGRRDAIGDRLESRRELVAVRLVVEDRRGEVEDEDDLGLVGAAARAVGTRPTPESRTPMASAVTMRAAGPRRFKVILVCSGTKVGLWSAPTPPPSIYGIAVKVTFACHPGSDDADDPWDPDQSRRRSS